MQSSRGRTFRGAVLDKVDFTGADIRGANLNGTILTNTNLEGVSLDGVSMEGALRDPTDQAIAMVSNLLDRVEANNSYTHSLGKSGKRGQFDRVDLRPLGDALKGTGLVGATFKNACGVGLDFRGAILIGAVFDGADLRSARFNGADLRGCSFKNCNLNHADFTRAELTAFDGVSGRRFAPSFVGATLLSTTFDDVVLDPDTTLDQVLHQKTHTASVSLQQPQTPRFFCVLPYNRNLVTVIVLRGDLGVSLVATRRATARALLRGEISWLAKSTTITPINMGPAAAILRFSMATTWTISTMAICITRTMTMLTSM